MISTPSATGGAPRVHRVRLRRLGPLIIGVSLLVLVILAALLAPLLSGPSPDQQDLLHVLAPPSGAHPLGTDELGRDVWSRLLYGARIDLVVGFGAIVIPFILGVTVGTLAGIRGGVVDRVVGIVTDVVMAFPYYVLLIALVFFLGAGLRSIFVAVALVAWVSYARIMRAEVRTVYHQDYVAAAQGAGLPLRRVIFRHVLPNTIDQSLIYVTADIVLVIVGTATLSYFGLGVSPPTAEWGAMINEGQPFVSTHPLIAVAPGIAIVLVGCAFGLIGQGLADLLRHE